MTDLEIRLGKSKRDLYLLLDGGKRRVRQDPQCRVAKEAFLKCGDLVAYGCVVPRGATLTRQRSFPSARRIRRIERRTAGRA